LLAYYGKEAESFVFFLYKTANRNKNKEEIPCLLYFREILTSGRCGWELARATMKQIILLYFE
jgi:hypothetical protein